MSMCTVGSAVSEYGVNPYRFFQTLVLDYNIRGIKCCKRYSCLSILRNSVETTTILRVRMMVFRNESGALNVQISKAY